MKYIGLMLTIGLLLMATTLAGYIGTPVQAPPLSNVEECTPVGTAGNQTVYRCEDWQMGKIVYVNNFGFLFVVEE